MFTDAVESIASESLLALTPVRAERVRALTVLGVTPMTSHSAFIIVLKNKF